MDPNATWNEILALYAQPGLASELLQRQDSQELDVVLYLFLRCAEAHGHQLDEAAKARAADHVRDWRDEVVLPLRSMRRALKTLPDYAGHREVVRDQIKLAELAAERAEVDMLCAWIAAD